MWATLEVRNLSLHFTSPHRSSASYFSQNVRQLVQSNNASMSSLTKLTIKSRPTLNYIELDPLKPGAHVQYGKKRVRVDPSTPDPTYSQMVSSSQSTVPMQIAQLSHGRYDSNGNQIGSSPQRKASSIHSAIPQNPMQPLALRPSCGCCSHSLYQSPEHFVNHIVDVLIKQPSAIFIERIASAERAICTDCLNCLFSRITIGSFYALTIPSLVRRHWVIFDLLYGEIMNYPNMHKLMMKECPLNKSLYVKGESIAISSIVDPTIFPFPNMFEMSYYIFNHNFGAICQFMINVIADDDVFSLNYMEMRKEREHFNKVATVRTLWLSMKYWNKYHVRYFVNHHLVILSQTYRVGIGFFQKRNIDVTAYNDTFYLFLRLSIDTVCAKAMCMKLRGILEVRIPPSEVAALSAKYIIHEVVSTDKHCLFHYLPPEKRNEKMRSFRRTAIRICIRRIPCGWSECKQEVNPDGDGMKKCGQCKMTFYCSRRCQKKAWKLSHRYQCTQLRDKYSM